MTAQTEIQHHAAVLLGQVAGYVGHRTVQVGLHHGLFERIAGHPDGVASADLAAETGLDPFYMDVWCCSAFAAGVLDTTGSGYRIDPLTATLLTDRDSPAYLGGLFPLFDQPEVFDLFSERLPTGQLTWWDKFGPEFIDTVASTCRAAYLRLVPGGLAQVPGLENVLTGGADALDLACGAGFGLRHVARTYPDVRLTGVDGGPYSLGLAESSLTAAGLGGRTAVWLSTLEALDRTAEFDAVLINMSMHKCRDIHWVTKNVHRALRRGGYFVISDFPFPEDRAGLRTVPGRIMTGLQFLEAQIDDQLLPTRAYVDLRRNNGFESVDTFELTPTHAVTHGRVPA